MTNDISITPERIAETASRIIPFVRQTPVLSVNLADFGMEPMPVDLKLECLQHSGSFKVRGAFSGLLGEAVPDAGVVAASGGNHGAAVAYAAQKLGVAATIFVPSITSPAKLDRIRSYGAELVVGGERYADALAVSEEFARKTGARPIHAFDDVTTLLGQGTLGREIEEQLPEITTLLVAVGGGGLIGGVSAWYQSRIKIVAVEPEGAPTLHMALQAGHPVDAPTEGIAADSLAPKQVGGRVFEIARQHVGQSVLVTDQAIRDAQIACWNTLRMVLEPGGAAAFAALLSGAYKPDPNERVAVLLCGANTDGSQLPIKSTPQRKKAAQRRLSKSVC
ncbi:threonine/serine dehydratase [Rhizobium sp. RU36D]|uniref:threonine/serine dehydratase n=1 Tax=Rhizobium sp. RU36D TaxID=1907415 RepID=UPI0009D7FEA4|nr:threonine/serine dehydratase [Rhizobium sp. RU36D]SMC58661.1 L-threonine ammonia-lyase [Rhizobium sp. RU36D]